MLSIVSFVVLIYLLRPTNYYPVPDRLGDGVLFSMDFFVSLLARLRENGWTDMHEIFREGAQWPRDDLIQFGVNSEKPRDVAMLISFSSFVNIMSKRLDRNFQGRCGVIMGRPDSIFGQFGETAQCRDANFFVSNITSKPLDRFAWNFRGRCGVTMRRPEYIFYQFRETTQCCDAQHGDRVCCAFAPQLVENCEGSWCNHYSIPYPSHTHTHGSIVAACCTQSGTLSSFGALSLWIRQKEWHLTCKMFYHTNSQTFIFWDWPNLE